MSYLKVMPIVLITVLLSGCAKTIFFPINFPTYFSDQIVVRNVEFFDGNTNRLDIYRPNTTDDNQPVIVFFYGGSWKNGDKENYAFVADALTDLGYVVVIPDYSKYPKVKFPTWQEDAAKAVAWVEKNIDNYGGSNDNIILMGHSAGAQIAALLITDSRYLTREGSSVKAIKAFVGLAGPYHFTPQTKTFKTMFGPPSQYPQMRVTTFVDGDEPPMLLLWGRKDGIVVEENILKLKESLDRFDSDYAVKYYDDIGHVGIVSSFSAWNKKDTEVLKDVVEFLKHQQQKRIAQ